MESFGDMEARRPGMFDNLSQPVRHAGMFDGLTPPKQGPTPEEMKAELERIRSVKSVEVVGHHVEIFDLHKPADRKRYTELLPVLIRGLQLKTHYLWENDRQLVQSKDGQRWLRYCEWTEYRLDETPTPTLGTEETA